MFAYKPSSRRIDSCTPFSSPSHVFAECFGWKMRFDCLILRSLPRHQKTHFVPASRIPWIWSNLVSDVCWLLKISRIVDDLKGWLNFHVVAPCKRFSASELRGLFSDYQAAFMTIQSMWWWICFCCTDIRLEVFLVVCCIVHTGHLEMLCPLS